MHPSHLMYTRFSIPPVLCSCIPPYSFDSPCSLFLYCIPPYSFYSPCSLVLYCIPPGSLSCLLSVCWSSSENLSFMFSNMKAYVDVSQKQVFIQRESPPHSKVGWMIFTYVTVSRLYGSNHFSICVWLL